MFHDNHQGMKPGLTGGVQESSRTPDSGILFIVNILFQFTGWFSGSRVALTAGRFFSFMMAFFLIFFSASLFSCTSLRNFSVGDDTDNASRQGEQRSALAGRKNELPYKARIVTNLATLTYPSLETHQYVTLSDKAAAVRNVLDTSARQLDSYFADKEYRAALNVRRTLESILNDQTLMKILQDESHQASPGLKLSILDPRPDLKQILMEWASDLRSSGFDVAAEVISSIDTSDADTFVSRLGASQDQSVALAPFSPKEVNSFRGESGLPVSSGYGNSLDAMLSGVVTVRVDKGIRIENGIGIPDRVIGSGFFIEQEGYILTNYHVIKSEIDPEYEGYSRLSIRLSGSQDLRFPAKVVGWDESLDVALLKAEVKAPFVFRLAQNPVLNAGSSVFAIGSPAGLESTVTSGIVSSSNRKIRAFGEVMQVDAALNPGNSGGPLLDASGTVVGMVFAGLQEYQGLNFCIPSAWIRGTLPGLFEGGARKHVWAGLYARDEGKGSFIVNSFAGNPGSMEDNVRILSVMGKPYVSPESIQLQLLEHQYSPGTLIGMRLQQAENEVPVLLELESRPRFTLEMLAKNGSFTSLLESALGISFTVLRGGLFAPDIYTVTKVLSGGLADDIGLSVNDPFSVDSYKIRLEKSVLELSISVKRRRAGFLQSSVFLEVDLDIPGVF